MTRTVKDAAHILSVIAGASPYDDDATVPTPFDEIPDCAQACEGQTNLEGICLGVPAWPCQLQLHP